MLTSAPMLLLMESSAEAPEASSNFHQLMRFEVTEGGVFVNAGSRTVSRKALVAAAAPSVTVRRMRLLPVASVAGMTRTVRAPPKPPSTMEEMSAGLEALAVTVSAPTGLSTSPI